MDIIHPELMVYVAYANGGNSALTDLKRSESRVSFVAFYCL